MTRQIRFLISVLLLVGLTCGSVVVAQKKKPRIKYYQIRANETFHVRLGQTLNSGKALVGDTFTTTVVDPVYSTNGIELVPAGSIISGRVTAVEKARIGAGIGAGVGFIAKKLKKGDEAKVEQGTEFGVILNRAISLPAYRPT